MAVLISQHAHDKMNAKNEIYYAGWLRKLPMLKNQSRRVRLNVCSANNRKIYEVQTNKMVLGSEVYENTASGAMVCS